MAKDAKQAEEGAEAPPKKSKKLLIIILAAVLVVVLAGGGAAFFLLKKSDHAEDEDGTEETTKTTKKKDKKKEKDKINYDEIKETRRNISLNRKQFKKFNSNQKELKEQLKIAEFWSEAFDQKSFWHWNWLTHMPNLTSRYKCQRFETTLLCCYPARKPPNCSPRRARRNWLKTCAKKSMRLLTLQPKKRRVKRRLQKGLSNQFCSLPSSSSKAKWQATFSLRTRLMPY